MTIIRKAAAIAAALLCFAGSQAQNLNFNAPAFLQPGDKIAIITPASAVAEANIDSACVAIERWGFIPVVGENALCRAGSFAGSTAQRKADLLAALQDPDVKAIFCSRGGYGSTHILCDLPLDSLAKYPKWIIGYSDITALHSAELCAGNMSIHASMSSQLKAGHGTDSIGLMLRNLLLGEWPTITSAPHQYDHFGSAEGILLGGNMSVYGGLAGSPYDFFCAVPANEIILFIEDVEESCHSVNRMLHLLEIRGILPQLKGIIVGRFKGCPGGDGFDTVDDMLHHYLQKYPHIPVAFDFPVSHDETHNYPLVQGAKVKFSVDHEGATLQFLGK